MILQEIAESRWAGILLALHKQYAACGCGHGRVAELTC